jgi:ribonuclease VapC
MVVVDASALVCALLREPGHAGFLDAFATEPELVISPVQVVEAMNRARFAYEEEAERLVDALLRRFGIAIAPIVEAETLLAIDAYRRFGKGRHPAGLNLGDVFAYAAARARRAPLLFKGRDFSATDVKVHPASQVR